MHPTTVIAFPPLHLSSSADTVRLTARGATEVAPSLLVRGQERNDVHFRSHGEFYPTNEVDFGQAGSTTGHREVNAGHGAHRSVIYSHGSQIEAL